MWAVLAQKSLAGGGHHNHQHQLSGARAGAHPLIHGLMGDYPSSVSAAPPALPVQLQQLLPHHHHGMQQQQQQQGDGSNVMPYLMPSGAAGGGFAAAGHGMYASEQPAAVSVSWPQMMPNGPGGARVQQLPMGIAGGLWDAASAHNSGPASFATSTPLQAVPMMQQHQLQQHQQPAGVMLLTAAPVQWQRQQLPLQGGPSFTPQHQQQALQMLSSGSNGGSPIRMPGAATMQHLM